MINLVRECKITITVNEKEKEEISKRAKEKHLPVATYCRSFLLSGDGVYYQSIPKAVPIERLKRPTPSKEAKNQHQFFMKECVFELKQKLSDPKPLKTIPEEVMIDLERRRELRMLKINEIKTKIQI